jgi:hypothetical protein
VKGMIGVTVLFEISTAETEETPGSGCDRDSLIADHLLHQFAPLPFPSPSELDHLLQF